jgi:hypothetical protein
MAYVARLRSLATTNLAVLVLRLIQFFFAGMEVGIIAYWIKTQRANGLDASSPYVFTLVVGVGTMLTQFLYCFDRTHRLLCLWDVCIGVAWILSFFWLLNFVSPLSCAWSAFNPFGTDHCGQVRAVLVIQIVLCVLWLLTALIGLVGLFRGPRGEAIVLEKV